VIGAARSVPGSTLCRLLPTARTFLHIASGATTSFSRAEPYPESRGGLAERLALSLPRHPDQHHPHVLVILGVDQEFRERARLRVDPVLADPASPSVWARARPEHKLPRFADSLGQPEQADSPWPSPALQFIL
jgi:hypothetical protein